MDNTDQREKRPRNWRNKQLLIVEEMSWSSLFELDYRPAQFISFIPFLFSSRMGREIENKLKWKGMGPHRNEWVNEVSGFICGGSETNKQRKLNNLILFVGWVKLKKRGAVSWVFFVGGLRAAASRRQQANKEDEPPPQTLSS